MTLTPQQLAVLRDRWNGHTIKEIAAALKRSPRTIEYHWRKIEDAFGTMDPVAVIRRALQVGIISLSLAISACCLADDTNGPIIITSIQVIQGAGAQYGIPPLPAVMPPITNRTGQSLRLCWEKSTSVGVIGYKVYQGGASNGYTNRTDVGDVTNATMIGLQPTRNYFFAATCYTSNSLESVFSAEVCYTVPKPKSNLVVTLKREGATLCFTNPTDGPRWWTNWVISKQYF